MPSPPEHRALAEQTVKKLGHDPRVMKQRVRWHQMYRDGELSIEGLRRTAPLIAAAEERRGAAVPG
jgi:hypothetical protein